MMTDAQALEALRRDPEAVCVLYDRYVADLVRFLCRVGATPEVAWDVTQETFARLLARGYRGPVTPELSAWPWLAVTSRNLLRDWQRCGRVDQSARIKVGARAVIGAESEFDEALARLDADRAAAVIAGALDSLTPSQRDAVLGRVVDEKGYDLLAAEALASEQTMRGRVSRGLRLIRARVEEGNT